MEEPSFCGTVPHLEAGQGPVRPEPLRRPRGDDNPAVPHLGEPRVRHFPYRAGGDDPVVGGERGESFSTVANNHPDLVPRGAQGFAGLRGDHRVNFDGGDPVCVPHQFTQKCGVPPGSGADLQHLLAGLHVERVQHGGHHTGGAR